MALTQGPSALRSRALRILALETREIPHTDYYVSWSSASARILLCDLKFCSSASTYGIFFGLKFHLRTRNILRLKVPQFRFHTIHLVWLEVSQFRFHTRALTLSPAVLLSHTEQSVTWSSAVSHNILWLEFPQFRFRKKRRHLKFRTSASAREHYFSFGKSTLIQPPTHFLIFVLCHMNDGPSEG